MANSPVFFCAIFVIMQLRHCEWALRTNEIKFELNLFKAQRNVASMSLQLKIMNISLSLSPSCFCCLPYKGDCGGA